MGRALYFKIEIDKEDGGWKVSKSRTSNLVSSKTVGKHKIFFKKPFSKTPETIDSLLSHIDAVYKEFLKIMEKKDPERIGDIQDLNNLISNPFLVMDILQKKVTTSTTGEIPLYVCKENYKLLLTSKKENYRCILLPPASIFTLHKNGLKFEENFLKEVASYKEGYTADLEFYSTLLIHIIKSRLEYIENIVVNPFYIPFSGGVDSSLLLKIAYENGLNAIPVTIGLKGSRDIIEIKKSFKEIGYRGDFLIMEVNKERVSESLIYIKEHLDIKNRILLSIALVEHLLMNEVRGKVLVMGQGADELFGGYDKYRRKYDKFTNENLIDRTLLYRATTLIEYSLGELNEVSVAYPYLTYLGILMSRFVPNYYKVRGRDDYHRKWVIRNALKKLGVTRDVYMRRKKAMQYSTGIDRVVKNILRRS